MDAHASPPPVERAAGAVRRRPGLRLGVVALAAILLSGVVVAPAVAATRPTVFYLSPTGRDSNAGRITSPWKSFHASLRKLLPGDTLYIRGGSYAFGGVNYTTLAGTSTRPILIAAYPGEYATFTGTTTPAAFLYFSSNSAWITLRGFTVRGGGVTSSTSGSSLLGFVGNANHIRIERMHLTGSPGWTREQHLAYIAASSVNDITFTGNVFDGRGCLCAGLLQLYHDPNAARVVVSGNWFRNADQAVLVWANVSGLQVRSNSFVSVRIAVRHHHSAGTSVTGNRGTNVRIGVYADSRTNLYQSGNSW